MSATTIPTAIAALKKLKIGRSLEDDITLDFAQFCLTHCRSIGLSPMASAVYCTIMEGLTSGALGDDDMTLERLVMKFKGEMLNHAE